MDFEAAKIVSGIVIEFHNELQTCTAGEADVVGQFVDRLMVLSDMRIQGVRTFGVIIDRFRAATVLPVFLLPLAATCFVFAASGPPVSLLAGMVLLGISYGFSSTLFGAVWPEIYGTAHLGSIRSSIVAAMVFATAAGPGLTGTLIDRGIRLPTQMTWFGVYCLLLGLAGLVYLR